MIICADVLQGLAALPDGVADCCVTSPPYWGLRDYGVSGQLGLEPTPQEYVDRMVAVFREVRRVLRDDGALWLNIGDSYITQRGGGVGGNSTLNGGRHAPAEYRKAQARRRRDTAATGLRHKDLAGVPWRLAFALQADGWLLRSDIVWHKPNAMPESVTDRPTRAHEYLFLLAKRRHYHYDAAAVREPFANGIAGATPWGRNDRQRNRGGRADGFTAGVGTGWTPTAEGRNRRSVWSISTQPYPEAHFAVMPEALAEPCVLAGSRRDGIVLDPFGGSGTVGLVARRLGRRFILLELNPAYCALARRRVAGVQLEMAPPPAGYVNYPAGEGSNPHEIRS